MEFTSQISTTVIFSIAAFIVYELLKQLDLFLWIRTHPKIDKVIRLIGSTIEGISISVDGAAIYQWFLDNKIMYYAFIFGTIWLLIGAALKDYNRK